MLFNSLEFFIFLPIVFIIYWLVLKSSLKAQNLFLLIASYVFYGWWDWRFLILIFLSSLVDFSIGKKLGDTTNDRTKKWLIASSVIFNLGLLGYFKYCNFFIESFADMLETVGMQANISSLNIILPVGISFYTFQTMSYSLDINKKELEPSTDLISFMAFVSFFPQLVAGPIERAKNLLPQFSKKRKFDYYNSVKGLEQILWGFFKKVVVADNIAKYANEIFTNSDNLPSAVLIIGAILFSFQIYCDFSGYSDIAIGIARLFGFKLMQNFRYPYFATSLQDFWRRWHISLSSWFRDYVYIPLGGNRLSTSRTYSNILIVFLVSGLWHGANWTFVVWGAMHGFGIAYEIMLKGPRDQLFNKLPALAKPILGSIATFTFVVLAFVFFRANDINHAYKYIHNIFISDSYLLSNFYYLHPSKVILPITVLIIMDWANRNREFGLDLNIKNRPIRWSIYQIIFLLIFFTGSFQESEFIYFQF